MSRFELRIWSWAALALCLLAFLPTRPIKAFAGPTCTLTPSGNLYGSTAKYTYRTSTTFSITGACSGSGSITYAWTNISGPVTPTLTNTTTATVSVSGNSAFGSYVIQLAATDMNGATNTQIKIGSVPTSERGIVNLTTALGSTYGPKVEKLNGPLIAVGSNIAPWYDDRHKAALDAAWGYYGAGQPYGPWYKTYGSDACNTGTVTITGGSATVTGSGTTFQDCEATAGFSDFVFVFRYTGTDGKMRYTYRQIANVASQTSLTLTVAYPTNAATYGHLQLCNTPCSGLSFVLAHESGTVDQISRYWNGSTPQFYYDIGTAFYIYYLRSGLDDYLTRFRTLEDDWWESPASDYGDSYNLDHFIANQARSTSLMGAVLRTLDKSAQGDDSNWTAGIRQVWRTYEYYLNTLIPQNGRIDDVREDSYYLAMPAECAIAEIDATEASACQSAVAGVAATFNTYKDANSTAYYWQSVYSIASSVTALSGSGSISLTNGSTSGTFSGSCPDAGGSGKYAWFWSAAPGTLPAYNGGDSTYYVFTCSGSTITLSKAYEGTTGTKGFMLGNIFVGWAAQPFMEGLLGRSFHLASIAVDGYSGNTARNTYRSMLNGVAIWLATYGYNTTATGMYSGVSYLCGFPIAANDVMCGTPSDTVSARRTLNSEAVYPIGASFSLTGLTASRTFGNLIFGEMFNKPGTNGMTSDTDYIADWNDNGFYISTVSGGSYSSVSGHKWLGQFFGYPESGSTWTAFLGGADNPLRRSLSGRVTSVASGH